RAASIQGSLSELENRASRLSRASVELRQLEREANAVRDSYETALGRLNETRSFDSVQRPEARIVERAIIPGAPTGPRVTLFTVLGGAVGFPLGLALALLRANNSAGFARSSDIERALELPLMASLPRSRWTGVPGMQRSLRATPYQGFAERVRQLRNGLALQSSGDPVQTVLITSSVPGEGKTTLAVALAMAEARANKSCVLLDFDLRGSSLAKTLGYAPDGGDLAGLLKGTCSIDDAVSRVPKDGYDLITVKHRDPQLLETTNPDQIVTLLNQLKARYDLVIIDTAPVLLVADTLPLARSADAALLLVKQGSTHRHAAREAARQLRAFAPAAVGLVMTKVDPRDELETYGVKADYIYEG
ncbi:MAG: AAA family ATPase, partial [Erythrobacter sp.]